MTAVISDIMNKKFLNHWIIVIVSTFTPASFLFYKKPPFRTDIIAHPFRPNLCNRSFAKSK